ncbi:MAG: helix-turn-helix domain-containing protein [Actinomycetota bacterium]|nr:helix-turn-helix domain-containing protein [Actinomycetota bacterium]
MIGAPKMEDALTVLDVHAGPDSRGRYVATCPECEDHGLRLDSDGAEKISATCPRRCLQVRINATIKKRIQAKGNGSSRHDAPETKTSTSKTPTRQGPGLTSWEAIRWALRLDLKPSAKLVLIAYCDHSGEDGRPVYPSHGRICALTGLSRRHVVTLTGELVEEGLLVEAGLGSAGQKSYHLDLDRGTERPALAKRGDPDDL